MGEKKHTHTHTNTHYYGFRLHVYLQLTSGKFLLTERKEDPKFDKAASCYLISHCRE